IFRNSPDSTSPSRKSGRTGLMVEQSLMPSIPRLGCSRSAPDHIFLSGAAARGRYPDLAARDGGGVGTGGPDPGRADRIEEGVTDWRNRRIREIRRVGIGDIVDETGDRTQIVGSGPLAHQLHPPADYVVRGPGHDAPGV